MTKKLTYILIILALILTSHALAKDTPPGASAPASTITPNPSIAPLNSRWNREYRTLSRFYPIVPITEAEFTDTYAKSLGLLDEDSQLQLKYEKTSLSGTNRLYAQTYKNIQVKDAGLLINLRPDGSIISVFNNILPIENLDVSPTLSLGESRAIAFIGIDPGTLRAPATGELSIALIEGAPRLVYEWRIPASDPYGDWSIYIDARTGEKLSRIDLRKFSVTGSGQVFIPDPKTAIESDTLQDEGDSNAAIPDECYSTVDLLEIDDSVGGIYVLSGPYVNTEPTSSRAEETSPDFFYLRQDDRFEEVMVYYHLDTYQRYIQSIGFDDLMNFSQSCNVNGTPDDNSWFSPMTGIITFGFGGVDDAEDADVIIHEYGHAIQHDIIPNWSGGHSGAMGEGFGDYIAGTYSLVINPDFHPEWVFTWDGHNQFWAGRWLNMPYHYPENAGGEIHDSGQLWSAGLIDVWYDVPDVEIWDKLVFQHHYYLGNGATMEDAANAILLSDIEINYGDYRQIIIENFAERGFIDPYYLLPIIEHNPLSDTEDTLQVEFSIIARITSDQPLDTASLLLYWGIEGVITDSLALEPAGTDTFTAVIPGPFNQQTVNYFLAAADIYGGYTTLPADAPAELFHFYVGPDTVLPEIAVLDTLSNTVFHYGISAVSITASDNIGLTSVKFHYRQEGQSYQWLEMTPLAGDTFTASASWSDLNLGMSFYYYFSAQDSSANLNNAVTPEYSFEVTTTALFDDFENGLSNWEIDGSWGVQNTRCFSPENALNDRPETGYAASPQMTIAIAQPWLTAGLADLHLEYWTQYFFLPQNDTGFVEINTGNGWSPQDTLVGVFTEWENRAVDLEPFLNADSLTIRFRTTADTTFPSPTLGWYIDNIILSVGPMVGFANSDTKPTISDFNIESIFPNPGNGNFTITFQLPQAGMVNAHIYNIIGQNVETIYQGYFSSGINRIHWAGDRPSGIYFAQIEFNDERKVAKILLVK